MWRLDRLKDEEKQIEQTVRELIYHTPIYADVMKVSCTRLYQTARQIIGNPRGVQEEEIQPELEVAVARQDPLPGDKLLLSTLRIFLFVTLATLGAAVVGIL